MKIVPERYAKSYLEGGLKPNTAYHFAVFEYNGTGATTEYLTSTFLTGNAFAGCNILNGRLSNQP